MFFESLKLNAFRHWCWMLCCTSGPAVFCWFVYFWLFSFCRWAHETRPMIHCKNSLDSSSWFCNGQKGQSMFVLQSFTIAPPNVHTSNNQKHIKFSKKTTFSPYTTKKSLELYTRFPWSFQNCRYINKIPVSWILGNVIRIASDFLVKSRNCPLWVILL